MKNIKIIAIALTLGVVFSFSQNIPVKSLEKQAKTYNHIADKDDGLSFICKNSDKEWG